MDACGLSRAAGQPVSRAGWLECAATEAFLETNNTACLLWYQQCVIRQVLLTGLIADSCDGTLPGPGLVVHVHIRQPHLLSLLM